MRNYVRLYYWIESFRPRTLPLALSTIIAGTLLGLPCGKFNLQVLVLSIITTILLQILANLANDYGDYIHGIDNSERIGPMRPLSDGRITRTEMKRAITTLVLLSSISGLLLILLGTGTTNLFFLILGIFSILAALLYTIGKRPYGYVGLGDLSVFIFFGPVGVLGTFILHTGFMDLSILLPSFSVGLFAVGVLNINNMRDIQNDSKCNKLTIPVRIGIKNAKIYHFVLIFAAIVLSIIYTVMIHPLKLQHFLFLILLPFFVSEALNIYKEKISKKFDKYLKRQSLATLLFSILLGVGVNF